MKKILCTLLVILTVIFTSCGKENIDTTDSETAETTTGITPLTTVQDDIEVLVNDSQSALDIYSMMYYTGTKQEMYISDYLANYELSVMKYSVIDLDGDSHSETVLWLAKGTYEYYGFLILHKNRDTVCGYELTYRAFYELKEDGIFSFSAGASDHGIGEIEFTNDTYSIKKIAYCESDYMSQKVSYYIENETVSQERFERYITEHDQKQSAEWHEFTKDTSNLSSYMRYLVNYFNEPYTIGDEIHRLDILTLVFHFCYSNRERLDFVKMDETTLDASRRILIEGEGLRKTAKMLLGENFEAEEYHEFLEYSSEKYDAETDTYSVPTAKDYWGGDNVYIRAQHAPIIEENESKAVVTAIISPTDGSLMKMVYEFQKVKSGEFMYYRLTNVREILPSEETTMGIAEITAALQENKEETMFLYVAPDFLTEEQKQLYNKASEIYPLFRGVPDAIYYLHLSLQESSWSEKNDYVVNYELSPDVVETHSVNGLYYNICKGKYQTIEAFSELCLSVFTDEYFDELNNTGWGVPTFMQIDDYLYHINASKGCAFGYDPMELPDTYELIRQSDSEISFYVIGHYKSSYDDDYTVEKRSFPITLTLTENGWRFSKFADAGLEE